MLLRFIGTSHGRPEPDRRTSCTMVEINGSLYFIDMGTEVIGDIRKYGFEPPDVRMVACTHPHGDHTDGIVQFVETCGYFYKDAAAKVILPNPQMPGLLRAWIDACCERDKSRLELRITQPGTVYEDENVKLTAIPTQHCDFSYAYLFEAEGKNVIFTGDLKHPTVDFPQIAFERQMDLIIFETAHFSPYDALPVLENANPKNVIHNHITPRNEGALYEISRQEHPFRYIIAHDGLEFRL